MGHAGVAIEKNVFNPQSGWVQIRIGKDGEVELKVSNFDYYVKSSFNTENTEGEEIIATVEAGTFIPLVAKLSNEYTKVYRDDKSLAPIYTVYKRPTSDLDMHTD